MLTADTNTRSHHQRITSVFLRFLGSMNLAIMLLVTIAIASVIGTILRQNEPYQNYIVKFGPYWHEIYKSMGLYDVYSSGWFILILAFLVISTSVCVIRNAPGVIRSMQRYRENIQERALRNMPGSVTWKSPYGMDKLKSYISIYLYRLGYRIKIREEGQELTIAAMKGASNRIGYLLTHIAIIIICVGGLTDGNLPLKIKTMSGGLKIETRDITVSRIPAESRLPDTNPSFRASVSIPEGAKINYAFINIGGGFLLQSLPFAIEVKDFRIEHYQNGQPKSFESDLVIHDPETRESIEHTIAVNHPLIYKGYTVYQASFADGGTRLNLRMHSFYDPERASADLTGTVSNHSELNTPAGTVRIEFDDFRKFNIFPANENENNRKFTDYGPSFTFKVRQPDGTASEYMNYMYPVPMEEKLYFLSGVRKEANDEFRYLYIPVDIDNSPDLFFRFQAYLHDDSRIITVARQTTASTLDDLGKDDLVVMENVSQAMIQLLKLFRSGGFDAISQYTIRHVPEQHQQSAMQAYLKVLQAALYEIYLDVLRSEGINTEQLDESFPGYFDDAVDAMNAIHHYGIPFYLQLREYEERQATGLQITRTPGKIFVYLGFTMLIAGIFLLFYVPHQRVWFMLRPYNQQTEVVMAGTRIRHRHDFRKEFRKLAEQLQNELGNK